jgi:hypothetical protein
MRSPGDASARRVILNCSTAETQRTQRVSVPKDAERVVGRGWRRPREAWSGQRPQDGRPTGGEEVSAIHSEVQIRTGQPFPFARSSRRSCHSSRPVEIAARDETTYGVARRSVRCFSRRARLTKTASTQRRRGRRERPQRIYFVAQRAGFLGTAAREAGRTAEPYAATSRLPERLSTNHLGSLLTEAVCVLCVSAVKQQRLRLT